MPSVYSPGWEERVHRPDRLREVITGEEAFIAVHSILGDFGHHQGIAWIGSLEDEGGTVLWSSSAKSSQEKAHNHAVGALQTYRWLFMKSAKNAPLVQKET